MVRNVLVVDDSEVERNHLEKLLMGAGYVVSKAENGEQALAAIKRSKPDAVLMDVNMPVMDGFAAVRTIRKDPDTKDLPVIMITAKDQKADKAWGQMLGARGYITKPYSDNDVLSQVRAL